VQNAANDTTEYYRQDGRLDSIMSRNGQLTRLFYSVPSTPSDIAPVTGLLIRIEDQFGHALGLRYNAQSQLITLVDPDGHQIAYTYDSNGLLSTVTYPDGKTRTYVYNEAGNVSGTLYRALTGIIDENSDRYATFKYANMVASTTMHGNGVDKYTITLGNGVKNVSDPLGRTITYANTTYTTPSSTIKIGQISQPSSTGSGTVYASWSYDGQFNVIRRVNFDGSITNYTYDLNRNLETSRVEAAGRAEARTISTAWHPSFRLPVKIAEPKRLTSFTYDAQGRTLTRTEQATTDANGSQGLTPTLTGQPRTWTWTYNQYGQVLTVTGPRTDIADITTYTYDASGNLATVTNALGQQTVYSNYDESGRVGRIVEPNGLVIERTYTPRGWLATSSVAAGSGIETTSFDYDGVGQVKKATFPNGTWITYTYDAAHRLTGIADGAGNTVTYTLDNAGNRIAENTTDPSGILTRQITRVYDTLNNLKQTTGATQ
jgi:YD repeat-containing protein